MTFDVYYPFKDKDGKWCPGVKAKPMSIDDILKVCSSEKVVKLIDEIRAGAVDKKVELPSVCWNGRTTTGKRLDSAMQPTQFVMLDVDHVDNAEQAAGEIMANIKAKGIKGLAVGHYTPRLGIRLVFRVTEDFKKIEEHMKWYSDQLGLGKYGKDDEAVKNIGRVSFLVTGRDFFFLDRTLLDGDPSLKGYPSPIALQPDVAPQQIFSEDEQRLSDFSDEEKAEFEDFKYRGTPIKVIIDKYVETKGEPGPGEKHTYYNEMVKNFRVICENNKRLLLFWLPRFGHTMKECWSQIVSICRVNTLSSIPKPFYFFLKDNGFYKAKEANNDVMTYMLSENADENVLPPYLPPVFRELVGTAPADFVIPAVNSLLPILGTLTSYVRATYPYDNREHSTSFFSVIYAPPGTGKGFVERFMDLLFEDLKLRDFVESQRENVYLRILQRKGANDKAPDMPHVSMRIIPAKNSEAEFLQKQQDNHGYHMFTYAAEMDSWAKGVRAAGGNKDDMIRVAWDNGEYGQQFKSANTFKGKVKLYWNVLITGTIAQVEKYFNNVENGLVTRCSFCSIENQEFKMAPVWGNINKRGMKVIKAFMKRCDANSYLTPCNVNPFDLETVNDDDFDKEVDWRFKFKPFKNIDMSWLMPTIDKFNKEQVEKAALDIDRARDVFRRRVAVRGFRLGMICYCLWENPRDYDLKRCIPFIEWWMQRDLDCMLKLWGARYNEQTDVAPTTTQRTVFDALGDEFTRNDVYTVCMKQGIRTQVRRIIFDWRKLGCIEQKDKEHFVKRKGYTIKRTK